MCYALFKFKGRPWEVAVVPRTATVDHVCNDGPIFKRNGDPLEVALAVRLRYSSYSGPTAVLDYNRLSYAFFQTKLGTVTGTEREVIRFTW